MVAIIIIAIIVGMFIHHLLVNRFLQKEEIETNSLREYLTRATEQAKEECRRMYKLSIEHKSQKDAYTARLKELNIKYPSRKISAFMPAPPEEDFKIMEDYRNGRAIPNNSKPKGS